MIDEGAAGTVQCGILSLQTNHGAPLVRRVVAKLGFQRQYKESLENEMSMYVTYSARRTSRVSFPLQGHGGRASAAYPPVWWCRSSLGRRKDTVVYTIIR